MPDSRYSGYATFSAFIASDTELSIYRSFLALTSRSLLYQQSELLALERNFEEFDEDDSKSADIGTILSSKCRETFAAKAVDKEPREAKRMETIRELRTRLQEYCQLFTLYVRCLN
jgi:hypothetical protein